VCHTHWKVLKHAPTSDFSVQNGGRMNGKNESINKISIKKINNPFLIFFIRWIHRLIHRLIFPRSSLPLPLPLPSLSPSSIASKVVVDTCETY
jgi:hypothetical protein